MLNTYDELVDSIVRWSHRKDVLDLIPDFIALAEYEMFNNEEIQLSVREMETISMLATSEELIDLPCDYEKMRSIKIISSGDTLDLLYRTPEQLQRRSNGMPRFYTIIGNKIEFDCLPDNYYDVSISFYKKPCPLTKDNQTNIIMAGYPNIYLFGVLHQLYLWSGDTDESVKYALKFQGAIKGANKADKKARYGVASSVPLPRGVV